MPHYKRTLIGLVLLSLTACGTLSAPPPKLPQAKPDPAWLEPTPKPQPQGRDNASLAGWTKALSDALDAANADKAAIRHWAEGL